MHLRAVTLAALVGLVLSACAVNGTKQTPSSGGPTGKDFYAGKTITFIVSTSTGGGPGAMYTIMKPALEKYLGATINLQFNGAGGGIPAENQTAAAKPDGLTIGMMSLDNTTFAYATGTPNINYSMKDVEFIEAIPLIPLVGVSCKGSKIKSLDDLFNSQKQVSVAAYVSQDLFDGKLFLEAYGISAKYITGYADSTADTAGCLAGQADLNFSAGHYTPESFAALGGPITPLVIVAPEPQSSNLYTALKDVPTVADVAAQYPPTGTNGAQAIKFLESLSGPDSANLAVFAPKGTPADRVQALSDAFKAVLADPTISAQVAKANEIPTFVSPDQIEQIVDEDLASVDLLKQMLGTS